MTDAAPAGRADAGSLTLAAGMAFLAGATDAYGVVRLKDLFVSFMSGNTTMLGPALGHGDWGRAGLIALLAGLFVAGAAIGAILAEIAGRFHDAAAAAAVALTLCVPLVWPAWTIESFVVAMGALNAALGRVGTAAVSLTYVTGTLVKFGQGLGRALCGRPEGWGWLLQAPMWLSLLAGAAAAVSVQARLGAETLWPLPALAALIAAALLARHALGAPRPEPAGDR